MSEEQQEVPTGAAEAVMAWVGTDKERAQLALDAEGKRETPRKGLTADLEAMLADSGDAKRTEVKGSDVHPQRFIATGDISHGVADGDDRRSLEFKEGEIVDSSDLTEGDLRALLSRGAIRPA